jgi:hypothetical protein
MCCNLPAAILIFIITVGKRVCMCYYVMIHIIITFILKEINFWLFTPYLFPYPTDLI